MGIASSDGENRALDPVVMEGVMRYAYSHYPAKGNYAKYNENIKKMAWWNAIN